MVRHEDLKPGLAKFNCTQCQNFFAFDWPQPPEAEHVVASKVEGTEVSFQRSTTPAPSASGTLNTNHSVSTQKCPRCEAQVKSALKECPQCGVMFEKVRKLGSKPHLKPPPELEEAWKVVLRNYSDLRQHEGFLQFCLRRSNLVYASNIYSNILETTPHDQTAKKMQGRIVELASLAYLENQARVQEPRRSLNLMGVVLAVGALLILLGIINPNLRAMIAVGSGMLAFVVGLRIFNKSV